MYILQNYYVKIHELERTHTQKFKFNRSQISPLCIRVFNGMNFNFIQIITSYSWLRALTHEIHSHAVSLPNSYFDCISIAICSLEIEWNHFEFKMFPQFIFP